MKNRKPGSIRDPGFGNGSVQLAQSAVLGHERVHAPEDHVPEPAPHEQQDDEDSDAGSDRFENVRQLDGGIEISHRKEGDDSAERQKAKGRPRRKPGIDHLERLVFLPDHHHRSGDTCQRHSGVDRERKR